MSLRRFGDPACEPLSFAGSQYGPPLAELGEQRVELGGQAELIEGQRTRGWLRIDVGQERRGLGEGRTGEPARIPPAGWRADMLSACGKQDRQPSVPPWRRRGRLDRGVRMGFDDAGQADDDVDRDCGVPRGMTRAMTPLENCRCR